MKADFLKAGSMSSKVGTIGVSAVFDGNKKVRVCADNLGRRTRMCCS